MSSETKTNWNVVFERRFSDFTDDELLKYQRQLVTTKIEHIPEENYKNYMELMRHILLRGEMKVSYVLYFNGISKLRSFFFIFIARVVVCVL